MIRGISHVTFIVKDLERSARIFVSLLGAREVYSSGDRTHSLSREKFFLAGGAWLVLMEGDSQAVRSYNHVAFEVAPGDFDACVRILAELGLETREGRPRTPGEGRSVYFYDYDDHLLELHAGSLEERLKEYEAK